MSIAATAVAETSVAAQTLLPTKSGKPPVKRQIVARSDAAVVPEAR